MGWELFSQYVRALREAQPKFFIYENNKSMSKQIRASITETFGFEPICINSALVSAQNRQRLYWCGIRNEDGSYRKANIEQPEDRFIFLKDILETRHEPFNTTAEGKAHCITATYYKISGVPIHEYNSENARTRVAVPVCLRYERTAEGKELRKQYEAHEVKHGYREHTELQPREDGKSNALTTVLKDNEIAEPVIVAQRGRNPEDPTSRVAGEPTEQRFEAKPDGKSNTLTTVQKDNLVAEPINCKLMAYELESVSDKEDGCIAMLEMPGTHDICRRVYSTEGKCPTLTAGGGGNHEPKVFDEVELVNTDGKKVPIYQVSNGMITVKGKTYPIRLTDGFWLIRKLTVKECMRLQTIPDWYEFPVSDTQAYKMLGNGWTVSVITHLVESILNDSHTAPKPQMRQMTIFDYPEAIPEEMQWK